MRQSRVLFLCTGNSARSQMAEGWLRHLGGDRFEVASAGTNPVGVNPLAVEAMAEVGIDLSSHRSEHVGQYRDQHFDDVITVCDRAKESCPVFPGAKRLHHWSFEDPAVGVGNHDERLAIFRAVRDQIRRRISSFLETD